MKRLKIEQIRSYNRTCPDPNDVVFKCVPCNKEFNLAQVEDYLENITCPYCGIKEKTGKAYRF